MNRLIENILYKKGDTFQSIPKPLKKSPMLKKFTIKDIALQIGVSEQTAKKYAKDIKEHFEINIICRYHVYQFLKIPIE